MYEYYLSTFNAETRRDPHQILYSFRTVRRRQMSEARAKTRLAFAKPNRSVSRRKGAMYEYYLSTFNAETETGRFGNAKPIGSYFG